MRRSTELIRDWLADRLTPASADELLTELGKDSALRATAVRCLRARRRQGRLAGRPWARRLLNL